MFRGANRFQIFGGNFNVYQGETSPVERLLHQSSEEAAHNSYACHSHSDSCFPGTRTQYIEYITSWSAFTALEREHRILWMFGPAGVGKTAVAVSCAKSAAEQGTLGASFFFSYKSGVVDLLYFFTTIAYQLSRQIAEYRDILEAKISHDPSLLKKEPKAQFEQLIIEPLLELCRQHVQVAQKVIFVDGIDESNYNVVHSAIIDAVVKSISDFGNSIPLRWAFFSRSMPHVDDMFTPLFLHVELSVSSESDSDIRTYLRGSLRTRRDGRIVNPSPVDPLWPSEDELEVLVGLADRLFLYAVAIANFIMDPNSLSPERRLQEVLSFELESNWDRSLIEANNNPLAELDVFYTVIMSHVPSNILPIIQRILLLHHELGQLSPTPSRYHTSGPPPARILANLTGISLDELSNVLATLRSVLTLKQDPAYNNKWELATIVFYHSSFLDFLLDSKRSKVYWIKHQDHWVKLALHSLHLLDEMYRMNTVPRQEKVLRLQQLLLTTPPPTGAVSRYLNLRDELYECLRGRLLDWCTHPGLETGQVFQALNRVDHHMFSTLGIVETKLDHINKFPEAMRPHILSVSFTPTPESQFRERELPDISARQEQIWMYIFFVLQNALSMPRNPEDMTSFRRFVEQALATGHSEVVHSKIQECCSTHIREMIEKQEIKALKGFDLLRYYVDNWQAYRAVISSLFLHNKTVQMVAFMSWKTNFYEQLLLAQKEGLVHTILSLINQRRDGGLIDRNKPPAFIRSLIDMSLNAVEHPVATHDDVYEDFKHQYLDDTRNYYTKETAILWRESRNSLVTYLRLVEDRLRGERVFLKELGLPRTDEQNNEYTQECARALLGDRYQEVYSGFLKHPHRSGDRESRKRIETIMSEVDGGVETLRKALKAHIERVEGNMVSNVTRPVTIPDGTAESLESTTRQGANDASDGEPRIRVDKPLPDPYAENPAHTRYPPSDADTHGGGTDVTSGLLGHDEEMGSHNEKSSKPRVFHERWEMLSRQFRQGWGVFSRRFHDRWELSRQFRQNWKNPKVVLLAILVILGIVLAARQQPQ